MKRRHWRKPVAIAMTAALALASRRRRRRRQLQRDHGGGCDDRGGRRTDDRGGVDRHHRGGVERRPPRRSRPRPTGDGASDTTAATGGGEYGLIDGVYAGADGFVDRSRPSAPRTGIRMQGITDDDDHALLEHAQGRPAGRVRAHRRRDAELLRLHQRDQRWHRRLQVARSRSRTTATCRTRPSRTSTRPSARTSTPAMLTIIGTPNNLAVWDTLNDECMPQLLQRNGRTAVGRHRQPPVDDRHAARLRVRGRPVGRVAQDGAPRRQDEGRRA